MIIEFDSVTINDDVEISKHANELFLNSTINENIAGNLKIKSSNDWIESAKLKPIPKMLFGEFWFENEICILFADSNVGKSILAVQIGESISRGIEIGGFSLEAVSQPVLLFDFELSAKQFENRYSVNYQNHYIFSSNFFRAELDVNALPPDNQSFEEYLILSIENAIAGKDYKILIIDNITYLNGDNEKAKDALPLMKQLKVLKTKHSLSILVLAHTPKRDMSKPITQNNLQGSKMLMNFVDSAFTIGQSAIDTNLRYIKQIKQRNVDNKYGSENVCVCEIQKLSNFLSFSFTSYSPENLHLRQPSEKDKTELVTNVKELHDAGQSLRKIGAQLRIPHQKVKRILDKLKINDSEALH